ncbi:hypothetical protein [Aquabacterium sp.]|uniref:hypothetical protein n=1 Tax=Aquabacterium sp. TaxID=1872578 RepID=UPI0025C6E3E9|nr:hypothetical protein [Aquabacterium sp.]
MLALLPWRAWAWSVMPAAPVAWGAGEVPVASAQAATSPHAATGHRPCHDAPRAAASDPTSDEAAGSSASTHTCTLCDICHAGLITPAFWRPPADLAGHSLPPTWHPQGSGRPGACELYRPPRA